jgi:hypothetical protein
MKTLVLATIPLWEIGFGRQKQMKADEWRMRYFRHAPDVVQI